MSTTQAGLKTLHFGQIYVSIADPAPDPPCPPVSTGSRW